MQATRKPWLPSELTRFFVALSGWLLALTATPIAGWISGNDTFPVMATIGVLAHVTATLVALHLGWSLHQIARLVVIVGLVTWVAEFIGSRTGFPFGEYAYTDALQPQLGHVPIIIPLAWLMMLPPAWAVTQSILKTQSRWLFAAVAGLVFTAWDLYLDPQMVARELWIWDKPGGYFGIPWVNYFGWWLVSAIVTFIVHPRDLPKYPLMIIYTLTWLFQAVGLGIFWGQPGPAICGFLGMGIFAILAWWKR